MLSSVLHQSLFRSHHRDQSQIMELESLISTSLSLKTITHRVSNRLTKIMDLSHVDFFLIADSHHISIPNRNQPLQGFSKNQIIKLIKAAHSKPFPITSSSALITKPLFQALKVQVIVPLGSMDHPIGVMGLALKPTRRAFPARYLKILESFTPKLSAALENSISYQQLKIANRDLAKQAAEAENKLRSAKSNLHHLDKLKDEFVYLATHELKNPVSAMKGYLSMIIEGSFGDIPPNLRQPIEQLNQSNQQLVILVNDLLNIARAEAGTLKIKPVPVNVCSAIEEVITSVQPSVKQKNLTIDYSCIKTDLAVLADPERLKEIFNNLIGNAIKYSEKGVITITSADDKDQIIIHIKDEGVGIAPKDQAKLFTRFFRVAEEVAKGIPGSGLGLFIVRQLVEKMGGKIWFSSKLGQGSIFSFSLPNASHKSK